MSLRFLYVKIPASQRICSYYRCQHPILRNIARTSDGRIWHYGCLSDAREEHHKCQGCFSSFDGTEAVWSEQEVGKSDEFQMRFKLCCPNCGVQVPENKPFQVEA